MAVASFGKLPHKPSDELVRFERNAQLDNAELVKYDPDGYLLAWFGGKSTGIHVYSADGEEVGYWQMEALPRGGYTVEQVKASMIEHMTSGEEYPY